MVWSVTEVFPGSSSRSNAERLVFILAAIFVLLSPSFFMVSVICQARTFFKARVVTSA